MAIKLVVYYNDRGESIWYWRCYEKVIIVGKKKIKLTFCTSHHILSYMNYHKKKIQIQINLFKDNVCRNRALYSNLIKEPSNFTVIIKPPLISTSMPSF